MLAEAVVARLVCLGPMLLAALAVVVKAARPVRDKRLALSIRAVVVAAPETLLVAALLAAPAS